MVLGLKVYDKHQAEAERQAALHAARQEAINLLTLDYRTVDQDVNRVLNGATGRFRDEFASRTADLEKFMSQAKSTSQGQVQSAGVVSIDDDSAEVLVVADQTVRGEQSKQPLSRHYRLSMGLERHGERWLVSKIGYVG
ncbi:MAG: hypothetical protein GEV03_07155 [Streptosporangiales bacterium]|nr:hypothetical protein [Streptosporangiales bacterium]